MSSEARLKGKRIAVFVDQLYQEMEVWYPYYRLIEEGAEVHLVGSEAGKSYPSKTGYPAVAAKSYAEIKAADYDGVVTPGGFAPDFRRQPGRDRGHPSRQLADPGGQGRGPGFGNQCPRDPA